jgi:predicted secreted protein
MGFESVPTHGKVSRIEKAGVKMAFTDGWNLSIAVDMADKTAQGDEWKSGLPGQKGWSGQINGSFAPGNTEHKAIIDNIIATTPVLLTDVSFVPDTGASSLSGNLYINSLAITTALGAVNKFVASFTGDGALSIV